MHNDYKKKETVLLEWFHITYKIEMKQKKTKTIPLCSCLLLTTFFFLRFCEATVTVAVAKFYIEIKTVSNFVV